MLLLINSLMKLIKNYIVLTKLNFGALFKQKYAAGNIFLFFLERFYCNDFNFLATLK